GKFIDLHLQLFTGTAYQNALLFQWADKLQNTANIVDGGAADLRGAVKACRSGVRRCHLISYQEDGSLLQELFSRDGIGTQIVM
ncbi:hypothetical protein MJL22_28770, partial [Salmonella enterica subsp. enterica serovar Montevideo]|nr:hypothetical protein [Salmonella enterica subsp. enterica serovar Montevideo]